LSKQPFPTNTLARGLKVLEALAEMSANHGATLQEIADASGENRSNVYRYLTTLCDLHWVSRDEQTFHYQLGPRLLQMAAAALGQIDVRRVAHPVLQELARETRLSAHLSILDGASIVYIDKVESDSPIQMRSRPGMIAPCHTTAMGKAMLATLSTPQLTALLPEELEARTPNSITTRLSLQRELARIRSQGFARDQEENEVGIACVGAALFDFDGEMTGAISLSGLAQDVTAERVILLGPRVLEAAQEISQRMGWRPPMAQHAAWTEAVHE